MRRPRPVHRPVPTIPGFRHRGPRRADREPAQGRAQIRRDGRARYRPRSGVFLRRCQRRRGHGQDCGAVSHAGRPREQARIPSRLRGPRVGQTCQHVESILGRRPARRSPLPRALPRQFSRVVPHSGPRSDRRHRGSSRRQDLLPAVGRCAVDEHGRAAVEPAPSTLPRPGGLRPSPLRRPHPDRGLLRSAVTRGLQRHLPSIRPRSHRRRRAAVPAGPRGVRRAPLAVGGRDLRADLPAAGADAVRPCLRRTQRRRKRSGGGRRRAHQLRLHADGHTPRGRDPAVAAGGRADTAQRRCRHGRGSQRDHVAGDRLRCQGATRCARCGIPRHAVAGRRIRDGGDGTRQHHPSLL